MSDEWNDIRDAAVAKMAASSGMATAGLRGASVETDDPPGAALPAIRMLPPIFTPLEQQNAYVSEYVLEFPFELLLPVPNGRRRADRIGMNIMRAAQLEWRSGFKLGLSSTLDVVDSSIGPASPGLQEYADSGLDGYRSSVIVQVYETHSARTP